MKLRWALILSLMSHQAMAADWWFVPWMGDHDALVYIDKSSLERAIQNAQVKALAWIVYRDDQILEAKPFRSDKQQLILDCDKKNISLTKGMVYSLYGSLVGQYKADSIEWQAYEAHSMRETMAQFICSSGRQPPRSIPVYDPLKDFEQRFMQRDRERKPVANLQ